MRINSWMMGTVVVVQPTDRFSGGSNVFDFREELVRLFDQGSKGILIDLSRVKHTDSAALGELVATHKIGSEKGIPIKLTSLPERLQDIFVRTQLDKVFEIFRSEDEAVASFTG